MLFDKDNNLKNSFYEQAREQTQHRVRNCSLNEAYPDHAWKNKARQAIRECDVVFVLVGQDTHNASGVLVETDMARSMNKPTIPGSIEEGARQKLHGGSNTLKTVFHGRGMSLTGHWTSCRGPKAGHLPPN